ncbi:hypothetical protein [Albidovulum inexpectatum]|uniref:hypothetical protein n=1 Tax=Albidovulum inexpectatum TaxID=196587 RepID=UPI001FE53844|nr:hypothetical protein [Albidovulum inexpectatum]
MILFTGACVSPAPDFFGAERHDLTLDGIDFVVYHKGSEVEVVRMNYLPRAQRAHVPALMRQVAERATGCRVVPNSMRTRLPGDTGVARFDLDCV